MNTVFFICHRINHQHAEKRKEIEHFVEKPFVPAAPTTRSKGRGADKQKKQQKESNDEELSKLLHTVIQKETETGRAIPGAEIASFMEGRYSKAQNHFSMKWLSV